MKVIYFFLMIFLLGGTNAQRKEQALVKPTDTPKAIFASRIIDSLSIISKKDDKLQDLKTDLLIKEKKKIEKENGVLKKEILRLRVLVRNKPDTVFFKKASFFKRLFQRRKAKREVNLKNDDL